MSAKRKIQKNRALVDAYELGSVLKPIMLSKAYDAEVVTPNQIIDIPRRLNLNDKIILDINCISAPIEKATITEKKIPKII